MIIKLEPEDLIEYNHDTAVANRKRVLTLTNRIEIQRFLKNDDHFWNFTWALQANNILYESYRT